MTERLHTHLWLQAQLRQLAAAGGVYTILQRGDSTRGTVLLKILNTRSRLTHFYSQIIDDAGKPRWLPSLGGEAVSEDSATEYVSRAAARDPDLWIVELESRTGENPITLPE